MACARSKKDAASGAPPADRPRPLQYPHAPSRSSRPVQASAPLSTPSQHVMARAGAGGVRHGPGAGSVGDARPAPALRRAATRQRAWWTCRARLRGRRRTGRRQGRAAPRGGAAAPAGRVLRRPRLAAAQGRAAARPASAGKTMLARAVARAARAAHGRAHRRQPRVQVVGRGAQAAAGRLPHGAPPRAVSRHHRRARRHRRTQRRRPGVRVRFKCERSRPRRAGRRRGGARVHQLPASLDAAVRRRLPLALHVGLPDQRARTPSCAGSRPTRPPPRCAVAAARQSGSDLRRVRWRTRGAWSRTRWRPRSPTPPAHALLRALGPLRLEHFTLPSSSS